MATLCLDPELGDCAWRDLHDWLGGAWAVLLSNPEDFQPLERRRGAFGARDLRALAVNRDPGLSHAAADRETVWLREPPFAAADPVSFAARALRGELLTARAKFVMLIDGSLKRQAMLKYNASASASGSVISGSAAAAADLLAAVDALRGSRVIGDRRVIGKAA
jgi:alkyl hydroperoxide reductase subunit AhpC